MQREGWSATMKSFEAMSKEIQSVEDKASDFLRQYDSDGNGSLDKKELKVAVDSDPVLAEFLGITDPKVSIR